MRLISAERRQAEKVDKAQFEQLKANIFCLKGLSHIEQMGLFIVLTILHKSDRETFERLKTACAQEDIEAIDRLLTKAYHAYNWSLPNQANNILEALNLNIHKSVLSSYSNHRALQGLLNLMTQASVLSQDKKRLSRYLKRIIRLQNTSFQHFDFDIDTAFLIQAILNTYGLNETSILCDGAAGTGLLAQELVTKKDATAILEYQSSSLKQLAEQLLQLEGMDKNKIKLRLNHPLSNELDGNKIKADFYVSFPNQLPLNFQERNALHSFSLIPNKGELSRNASDALWVQYALSSLQPNGMAIIAVQDGFLRRPGYDLRLRKYLIDNFMVEMVIALDDSNAKQTQYNSISLIVINLEPKKLSDTVEFIDLRSNHISLEGNPEIMDSLLWNADDYEDIHESLDSQRIRYDVSFQTLKEHNYSLQMHKYLPPADATLPLSPVKAKKHYLQVKEKLNLTMLAFEESLGGKSSY